jgi:hypothetical protein
MRVGAFEMPFEGVEPADPMGAIGREPGIQLGEWLGPQAGDPTLGFDANVDEARVPEHSQMARHPGLMHTGEFDQLTDGSVVLPHVVEDLTSGRLRDHIEHGKGGGHVTSIRTGIYMARGM